MKPETQIKYLIKHIQPLADFYHRYRPSAQHIHIHRADWQLLNADPELARANGFVVHEGKITYTGFEVVPTDCGSRHHHE